VNELEKLRCNICFKIFTVDLPPEAGTKKYDATAVAMLAVLRYGSGLPLNRLAGLQAALGVPLAASTSWEVTEKLADRIHPAFSELIRQAAQGDIFHNDDTTMKILELTAENRNASPKLSRTGIFTAGILSILNGRRIAIFCTGRKHAGENLATLLTLLANCLTHGRPLCSSTPLAALELQREWQCASLLSESRNKGIPPHPSTYCLSGIGRIAERTPCTKEEQFFPRPTYWMI
jgi:hypothetical protein